MTQKNPAAKGKIKSSVTPCLKWVMCINILAALAYRIIMVFYNAIGAFVILTAILWFFIFKNKRWARICFYVYTCFNVVLGVLGVFMTVGYIYRGHNPLPCILVIVNSANYLAASLIIKRTFTLKQKK